MFYFIFCSLVWGLTWIAIKYQFHSVDSNVAVFYRFIVASALLFIFVIIKRLPLKFNFEMHRNFALQGFFMFCLNYLLTYWASHLAPSALVALAFTCLIYFNLFGGKIFLKIPIEKKVLYGAIVSLLGMALITYNGLQGVDLQPTTLIGVGISLIATASASAGNLISMKSRQQKVPVSSNNAWGMLYGSIATLIYCLITNRSFALYNIDASFIYSFLYLTLFGTILSFGAYLKLIETIGPAKAAFTSVISPIIAFIISILFENLHPSGPLVVGMTFCILGNIVALMPKHLLKKKAHAH